MNYFDSFIDVTEPNPLEKLGGAVKGAFTSSKETVSEALDTPTGKHVKTAASLGLIVGVGIGSVLLIIGTANGIVNSIFGSNN